jgi:hypothetical protein
MASRQFRHRRVGTRQARDDSAPDGIGERGEGVVELLLLNQLVQYSGLPRICQSSRPVSLKRRSCDIVSSGVGGWRVTR